MEENDELKWLYVSCDSAEGKVPSTTNQRIKRELTLAERINVIRMAEKIPNTPHLARMFGCCPTQIQNILRHRQEYLDVWSNNGNNAYRTKRKRSLAEIALNTIVYEWIQRCRSNGVAITDDDIRQTGQRVANILKISEIRPSKYGWLSRLKRAYKLNDLDLLGLNPTVNGSDIIKESIKLEHIIANFRDSQHPLNHKSISICLFLEERLSMPSSSSLSTQPNQVMELNESESQPPIAIVKCESEPESEEKYETKLKIETELKTYAKRTKNTVTVQKITSYKEALNHLGPLEHFSLLKEDIRAVGLINQLQNLFKENMQLEEGQSNFDMKK